MKHPTLLAASALLVLAAPAVAQEGAPPPALDETPMVEPELDLQQTMAMRCSIAFALVADWQADGEAAGDAYPPIEDRGREYFVRTMSRLMDETGMDRDELRAVLDQEVEEVQTGGMTEKIMPACLVALDASGL